MTSFIHNITQVDITQTRVYKQSFSSDAILFVADNGYRTWSNREDLFNWKINVLLDTYADPAAQLLSLYAYVGLDVKLYPSSLYGWITDENGEYVLHTITDITPYDLDDTGTRTRCIITFRSTAYVTFQSVVLKDHDDNIFITDEGFSIGVEE